jgi:hypothetical protein
MYKKDELKRDFRESLSTLLEDKEAQGDEEIVDFYMGVCCTIADEYAKERLKQIFDLETNLTRMFDSDVRVALAILEEIRNFKSLENL